MTKPEKYEAELLAAIKKHKFMRFDHCFNGMVSFSRATACNHGLDKLDNIKEALHLNRMYGVTYLLNKWIASDNPTLQLAAMRMICESDDHRRLNQQYMEGGSEEQQGTTINITFPQDFKPLPSSEADIQTERKPKQ